jgi:hypothetical protein
MDTRSIHELNTGQLLNKLDEALQLVAKLRIELSTRGKTVNHTALKPARHPKTGVSTPQGGLTPEDLCRASYCLEGGCLRTTQALLEQIEEEQRLSLGYSASVHRGLSDLYEEDFEPEAKKKSY